MLSSLKHNINYYGTDPNFMLVKKLIKINKNYKIVNNLDTSCDPTGHASLITDIRCQGSEIFIREWTGKMGMIFSSPPYYRLEDYKIGEQSIKFLTNLTELNATKLRLCHGQDFVTDEVQSPYLTKLNATKSYKKWLNDYIKKTVKN